MTNVKDYQGNDIRPEDFIVNHNSKKIYKVEHLNLEVADEQIYLSEVETGELVKIPASEIKQYTLTMFSILQRMRRAGLVSPWKIFREDTLRRYFKRRIMEVMQVLTKQYDNRYGICMSSTNVRIFDYLNPRVNVDVPADEFAEKIYDAFDADSEKNFKEHVEVILFLYISAMRYKEKILNSNA